MRVVVRKESLGRILKWSQRALFVCGVLCLGYCGFALVDAWTFERRENGDLDRLLRNGSAASESGPESSSSRRSARGAAAEGTIGRIEIPRLLFSVVVVEGIDHKSLRRAAGHIPGTALPGQTGNVGLAGHRDTFFRPLKDLRIKDEIRFSTLHGNFKYEVVSLKIVDPDSVGVLAQSNENVLTLVTCYPFYFVGPAPQRWIVRARQVSPDWPAPSIVE
jgi:sortase A